MTKYVKFISETQIEYPPKNKGNIINYDLNIEAMLADGFKEFIEAAKEIGKAYTITYVDNPTNVTEIATEIIPDPAELLRQAKENKIFENDTARDAALNQGVVYNEIRFDSDTDQKVNLLATVSMMSDEDTIIWFGMDNTPLECTKEDLLNIGGLIIALHTFCWNKNAEIKNTIANALTVEEVNGIEVDYEI